jgi:hypothetical protein
MEPERFGWTISYFRGTHCSSENSCEVEIVAMLIVVPACRKKSGKPKTSDTVTAKGQESKLQIVKDTDRSKALFTDGRFPVLSSDVTQSGVSL